jgi:penicillin-binding protein 1A
MRAYLGRIRRTYLVFEDWLDERLFRIGSALGAKLGGDPSSEPSGDSRLGRLRGAYLAFEHRLDRALAILARPVLVFGTALGRFAITYHAAIGQLRPRGAVRLASEGLSGAMTLAAVLGVVMLALAGPAFRETEGDWLKRLHLSVTFLDREGREIGHRGIWHDDRATLDRMPPLLVNAVIAAEDRRFFDHHGIDPVGIGRALAANARASGIVQGGSTLTQQLAKNLFLTNERSLPRKIKEAFLALWLESHFSKSEILQLYLDRAYMGAGTFGIGAASQTYFGKPIDAVNLSEAAMLAGLFKAPTRYAPTQNLAAAQARAGDVLTAMADGGYVTRNEAAVARAQPAIPLARPPETRPDYYLDWAFHEVEALAASGRLGADTVLTVKTPLDGAVQEASEAAIAAALEREGGRYRVEDAAMVVMEPEGGVRAMVGGSDYGDSQFNRATDAKRQPGSSFKPFVYASALAFAGYRPDSVVSDTEVCIGRWCPRNYGGGHAGAVPLWLALAKSINTIPVKLSIGIGRSMLDARPSPAQLRVGHLAESGRARIIDLAHRMGLRTPLPDSASLPIGAAEVTVLDMTAAYSVFANGGHGAPPYAAAEIRNSRGQLLYERERDGPRRPAILPAGIVAEMNTMLARVPEQGTGKRAALPGIRSAGKTGTTNGYRDAWYVGYTGDLVAGIWFGNDDYTPSRGMTGGSLPAMAWRQVMSAAHKGGATRAIPGLDGAAGRPVAQGIVQVMPTALAGRSAGGFRPVPGAPGGFQPAL